MIARRTIFGLVAAAAVGVGAYAASVGTRPAATAPASADSTTQTLMNWLAVPPDQRAETSAHDPRFAEDLKALRTALAAKRLDLAAALDDPTASDASIRGKLDALIAADAGLERRVADYLLAVRHHLTAEQQRRLFGLCAEGVRQGPNCPWRIGQDAGGPGRGIGPRRGMGRGPGGGGFGPGPGGAGFGPGRGRGQGRSESQP